MVNKPVVEWGGTVGPEIMADRLDGLERTQDVEFLAEDRVLGAAKPEKCLRA